MKYANQAEIDHLMHHAASLVVPHTTLEVKVLTEKRYPYVLLLPTMKQHALKSSSIAAVRQSGWGIFKFVVEGMSFEDCRILLKHPDFDTNKVAAYLWCNNRYPDGTWMKDETLKYIGFVHAVKQFSIDAQKLEELLEARSTTYNG